MPNTDNLCMSCMKPIGDQKQCPYCGYHSDSPQLAPYLPVKTVVANRYLIGKVIDFNGDGVTYMGWDMSERVAVKVREFLRRCAEEVRREYRVNIYFDADPL